MNRRPLFLVVALVASCTHDVAGPVVPPPPQTTSGPATGSWMGNGPNFIFAISLSDTVIVATGVGTIGGTGEFRGPGITGDSATFNVVGLDSSGILHLVLISPSHLTAFFYGLALPGDTAIDGTLDGSGFSHIALSLTHHPVLSTIEVGPRKDSLVAGHTAQFVDSGFDLVHRPLDPPTVVWTTSDTTLATVSATGVVTGVRAGLVVVSATDNGITGRDTFRVLRPTTSVVFAPPTITLVSPGTQYFAATALDSVNAVIPGRSLSWSSSNPAAVQVSSSGGITAADTGTVTITARAILDNRSGSGQVVVRQLHVASLTAGYAHTCAIDADSTVACWGDYALGLPPGAGTTNVASPVFIPSALKFQEIGAGDIHTCGLTVDSTAYCWGSNVYGQLGTGFDTRLPAPVVGGLKFTALAVGFTHTCGLVPGGAAYCWGRNASGELGNGTTSLSGVPVAVSGGLSFASLAAGWNLTCGLTPGGTAYCWGSNSAGALGDGTDTSRSVPTAVSGGLTFSGITTSGSHTCGITISGAAYCWGSDGSGELGDSDTAQYQLVPVPVHSGGVDFTMIAAGFGHTCARATSGAIYCWGDSRTGEVGPNGDSISTPVPVPVGLSGASVATGGLQSCAITPAGAYCWGDNLYGELGGAGGGTQTATPLKINGQP